jgi:scyllo-inositol 2-dehydrogenase (NADP+)
MNKIRIASIGSGWVVTNRHLPSLSRNKKFEITAIISNQEEKLKILSKQYKIPYYLLSDASKNKEWLDLCDAVMIGTDPMSHYKIAKFCLENGKHVLIEKPFTTSIKESEELVNLAKKKKLKLGIMHNMQFSDAFIKLDKEISNGKIGKIKGLYAFQFGNHTRRLPVWYDQIPWGLFFDESPHLIYLLDKYAKGVELVNSVKFNSTRGLHTPALINATFKTKIGVPASLYLNFESSVSEWGFLVIGEKRIGVADLFRDIYFSLPNDNGHEAFDILRTGRKAVIGHLKGTFSSGLKIVTKTFLSGANKVVDKFANSILNGGSLSPIDAEDALRANKLQFELINNSKEI